MIQHWSPFAFIALFVVILAAVIVRRRGGATEKWPFEKKHVLSESEQAAYWRLRHVAPDFIVLAQVAMSAFVDVKRGIQQRQGYRNRFDKKFVDFALCRKDGSILAVIEIDEKSHSSGKRTEDDRVKDKIIEAAGIPILRWKATPLPSEETMRSDIAALTTVQSMRVTVDDKLSRG
jgi:very-short-patch-repair endonuclease